MRRVLRLSGEVVLLILLSSISVSAKEQSPPLILKHADQLETNLDEKNMITNLFGKVWFLHGDLSLKSQQAVWYRSAGQVVLIGQVELEDSTRTLNAERVVYYQKTEKAVATGNVRLLERKDKVLITGQKGEYDREKKYAKFTESPKLVIKPQLADSSLTVTAKKMEYYKDQELGIASDSVTIQKNRLEAKCAKATWFNRKDLIVLSGLPFARQENDEISGDSMLLHLSGNRLERIEVLGRAKATQRLYDSLTSRFNESFLTSQKVIFRLEQEKVKEVRAINQATSLYIPSFKDTLELTKNETSGDTIQIFIDSSQVKRVLVKGGAQGRYFFIPEERKNDRLAVEDTVFYQAGSIDYDVEKDLIGLKGESSLRLGNLSLSSAAIQYDVRDEILTAAGELQEVKGDTQLVGTPVLNDGKEDIVGQRMVYNLSTRQGKIETGQTKFEKGFYSGRSFYKIEDREFLASQGEFTTCDRNDPHYHFSSSKMKLITEDKVIAQPVVLYIGDVPIAGLPFYVFPIKPGRHSGFLTFDIGRLTGVDRFVRNLGYYWAISEYMDLETALDIYEEQGIVLKGIYRYAVRHLLSGQIGGSYKRESRWDRFTYTQSKNYRWDLNFNHSQELSPTTKLAGSGTFLSDNNYYRDFNLNAVERRNRVLRSQLNLSKRWSQAGANIALEQNFDLDRDSKTLSLPSFSYNRSKTPFFPASIKEGSSENRWYNSIYFNFISNWKNFVKISGDTAGVDSTKRHLTADHSGSISFNPKLFGFLNLSQTMGFRESWYYVFKTNVSQKAGVLVENPARAGSVNFSLRTSTNLYGTFPLSAFGLKGFRHTFTPAVSFAWQPKFDRHQELRRFTGVGPASSKSQVMSFSAGNVVLVKTQKDKKLELFNLVSSSSYNFLAPTRKLGLLQTSFRSKAVPNLDLQFNSTHDFYDPSGTDLNLFNPRLIEFAITTHFNWQQKTSRRPDTLAAETDYIEAREGLRFNLSHRYSENKSLGIIAKNHWVNLGGELWATGNWKVNYSARYDIIAGEMAEQVFEIYRDLHCWEGRLTWVPSGFREGFYFRINIKALPEIKFEKGGAGLGTPFY